MSLLYFVLLLSWWSLIFMWALPLNTPRSFYLTQVCLVPLLLVSPVQRCTRSCLGKTCVMVGGGGGLRWPVIHQQSALSICMKNTQTIIKHFFHPHHHHHRHREYFPALLNSTLSWYSQKHNSLHEEQKRSEVARMELIISFFFSYGSELYLFKKSL